MSTNAAVAAVPPPRPRARAARRHDRLWQVGSVLAVAIVWEIGGRLTNPLLFPTLSSVGQAWLGIVASGELVGALGLSMSALLIGLTLSLVVGILGGIVMGWFRSMEHVADTLFTLALVVPTVGLVPLLVIAFGLELQVRVVTIFLFTAPIVALNSYSGTKSVDRTLVEMARTFGAGNWQILTRVVLPASVPGVMAGIRLGIGRSVTGMLSAELLIVSVGIGLAMQRYSNLMQTSRLFATVLSLILLGVLLTQLGQWLDRTVTRRQGAFEA
jgi:NitT/TauT family transport system permease protein